MNDVVGSGLVGGFDALFSRMSAWGYMNDDVALFSAVLNFQDLYQVELDARCRAVHGRASQADGEIGPATAAIINGRFCNVSDFSTGLELRWPEECVDDLSVSWAFANFPGSSVAETVSAWDSLSQYEDLFELRLPRVGNSAVARIQARLARLSPRSIAWSNLAYGDCSQIVQQRYSSAINWRSMPFRVGVVRHEVGHALGMRHTPSDPNSVMYPANRGKFDLNATDIAQMEVLGYIRRDAPPPSPDDNDDPALVITAEITVDGRSYFMVEEK